MRFRSLAPFVPLALLTATACGSAPPPAPAAPAPAPAPAAAPAPSVQAAPAPSVTGVWLGTLDTGGPKIRVQFQLDLAATPPHCVTDSIDQGAFGIACGNVVVSGNAISLDVPPVAGKLTGTIAPDGNTINASWTQGGPSLSFVLTRQEKALAPVEAALDPALPPVELANLQSVLDKDLAPALTGEGDLAPATEGGVTIGVVVHGVRKVLTYGTAKADSVFEIGSITKTFTGLILAQLVEQKKAKLDEPVRALLPAGTVAAPASGAEITLVDLSAQHSGLPPMPTNFKQADPNNPYADYDEKALYEFMSGQGVALPAKPHFAYSNLGVGLLGNALSHRAGTTYEALLRKEVTGPLGLKETVITLSPALKARFIQGHDGEHKPAHAWDLTALAGAGAIRSTAADMLTYLEAQLHPEKLPAAARATPEGKTLPAAIALAHEVKGEVGQGMHIALNWFRIDATGSFWHNGGTGGYSSFALFNPEKDIGVVVLFNTAPSHDFADNLGKHIVQRLYGVPAVSVAPIPAPGK